ncbi:MAG TPA: hypothetical protein EYG10_07030 [Gammaproteobacteria bacterium]|nr:hypothetical protein [Gammaproteobacteria bacterium]
MKNIQAILTGILGLGLCLTGCRTHTPENNNSNSSGVYKLVSINDHELPYSPPHAGGAPEVRAGEITLIEDGSFTSAMNYGLPDGKETGREFKGSYSRNGSDFHLKWEGAGTTTASLEGDTFTMNNEGVLFAYRK